MKCQLMVGATWDIDNEVLLDWDKRVPCNKDVCHIYTYGLPSFQGAQSYLCQEHHHYFIKFAGTLQPYIGEK